MEELSRRNRIQQLIENRYIRVIQVMNVQINSEYKTINPKYAQDSWIVCLDDFASDSQVTVTNECSHVFHTTCLKEWYDNTDPAKDLTCPHWSTVNTKDSSPQDENKPNDNSMNASIKNEDSKQEQELNSEMSQNPIYNTNRNTYSIGRISRELQTYAVERNLVRIV